MAIDTGIRPITPVARTPPGGRLIATDAVVQHAGDYNCLPGLI